jgi:GT2 family glycosyltransferase
MGLIMKKNKISIVCITYNHLPFTKKCIESVLKHSKSDALYDELIVVDNGSTDGTQEYLPSLSGIKYHLYDENKGCAVAKNQGMRLANPQNDILILDNDNIIATPKWLEKLSAHPEDIVHPYVFVSHKENCSDDMITSSLYDTYMDLRTKTFKKDTTRGINKILNVLYPDGLEKFASDFVQRNKDKKIKYILWPGCFLIRRHVIEAVGVYDENFGKCAWYDVDLAKRATLAGYKSGLALDVYLHHFGSITTRKSGLTKDSEMKREEEKSSIYYEKKWNVKNPDHRQEIRPSPLYKLPPELTAVPGLLSNAEQQALYEASYRANGLRVEIGSFMGKSSCTIAAAMIHDTDVLVSIDPFRTADVGGITKKILFDTMKTDIRSSYFHLWHYHMNKFCPGKSFFFLVAKGEEKAGSIASLDRPISLLFIDTDHSEQSTRDVLEAYLALVDEDGVIAIHDHGDPKWGQYKVVTEYLKEGRLIRMKLVDSLLLVKKGH